MPTYSYTRDADGKTLEVTGPRPLTSEEVLEMFSGVPSGEQVAPAPAPELPPSPEPEPEAAPEEPRGIRGRIGRQVVQSMPQDWETARRQSAQSEIDPGADISGFMRNLGQAGSAVARGVASAPFLAHEVVGFGPPLEAPIPGMTPELRREVEKVPKDAREFLDTWKEEEEALYRGEHSFPGVEEAFAEEGLWEGGKELAGFLWEGGIHMIPGMVTAVQAMPLYAVSLVEDIARERARADGRTNVTPGDAAFALPAAAVIAGGEKLGAKAFMGKLGPGTAFGRTATGRILTAMAVEGGTEAVQEVTQYAAERTGTQQGWDLGELWERVKPAVVLGTFVGGAGRGVAEAVDRGFGGREPGVASEAEDPGVSPAEEISALMEEEAAADAEVEGVVEPTPPKEPTAPGFYDQVGPPMEPPPTGIVELTEEDIITPMAAPTHAKGVGTQMDPPLIPMEATEEVDPVIEKAFDPSKLKADVVSVEEMQPEETAAPEAAAPKSEKTLGLARTGRGQLYPADAYGNADTGQSPVHAVTVGDDTVHVTSTQYPDLGTVWHAYDPDVADPVKEGMTTAGTRKDLIQELEKEAKELEKEAVPVDQREVDAQILESRMGAARKAEEALTVQEASLAALQAEWGPPPLPDAAPRPTSRKDKPKEKAAPEISMKEALFNAAKTQLDPTISFDVMFNEFMTFYAAAQRENRRSEAQEGVSAAANVYTEMDLEEVAERQGLTKGDIQALTKRQKIGFWQTMEMVRDAGLESTVDPDGRVSVPPEMLAIIDNALSGDYNPSLIQEAALLSLTQALKKSNKRLSERSKNTKDLTELREIGRRVERGDKLLIKSLAAQIRGGSAVARVMRFRQFLVDEDMTVQDAIAKAAVMSATERETELTEKETAKIRKLYHSADALEAEATKRIEEAKSEAAAAMDLAEGLKKKQALLKGLIEDTEGISRAVFKRKKKKDAEKKRKEKARKKAAKKARVAAEPEGAPILGIRWPRPPKPPGEKATPREEAAEGAIPVRVTMEGGPRKKRGKKEDGIKVAPLLKSDRQLELEREYRESQKRANDLDALAEASEEIMDEAGIPAASMSRSRLDAAMTELAEARKSLRDIETPAEGVVEPEGPAPSIQDIIDKNLFEARRRLDEAERMMVQAAADAEGMADKVDPERARDEAKARRALNAIERKLKNAEDALAAAAGKDVKARSDIRNAQRRKAAAAEDALHPWKRRWRDGLGISIALSASGDDSAIGRQAIYLLWQNPIQGLKTIPLLMTKVAPWIKNDRANALKIQKEILDQNMQPLRDFGNLELTEVEDLSSVIGGDPMTAKEEMFMFRVNWERPVLRHAHSLVVKPSENVFGLTLNLMRSNTYDKGLMMVAIAKGATLSEGAVGKHGLFSSWRPEKLTDEDVKQIQKYITRADARAMGALINVSTGRGDWLSGSGAWANVSRHMMFAPRFTLSRIESGLRVIQLFSPDGKGVFQGASPETRSLLRKRVAANLGFVFSTIVGGSMALGGDDWEDSLDKSLNPQDPDFMKLRMKLPGDKGVLRMEMTGGMSATVRHLIPFYFKPSELWRGDSPLDAFGAKERYGGGMAQLVRNKLAPLPGAIHETLFNENFRGSPLVDMDRASLVDIIIYRAVLPAVGAYTPIFAQNIVQETWEQYNEVEKMWINRLIPVVLDQVGIGAAHYEDRGKKKRRDPLPVHMTKRRLY